MSLTLRNPNEMVTASKLASAKGSRSASPADEGQLAWPCLPCLPTRSIPSEKSQGTTKAPAAANGQRRRPGAGGQVEHARAGLGVDRPGDCPAPQPGLTEREHVVGQVVARGDGVEHRRDLVRLLRQVGSAHPTSLSGRGCAATASPNERPDCSSSRGKSQRNAVIDARADRCHDGRFLVASRCAA